MSTIVRFSDAVKIALRGTILIAKSDKFLNVKKIAETINGSSHHIAKVMQRLSKEGYIKSLTGPTGGFILVKKPEEISFLNLYEAIEGKIRNEEWAEGSIENRFLGSITQKITQDFIDYMGSQIVADYL